MKLVISFIMLMLILFFSVMTVETVNKIVMIRRKTETEYQKAAVSTGIIEVDSGTRRFLPGSLNR